MKKVKDIKGNSLKNAYDPALAKPHEKGAVVEIVQTAKDNKWGRYYFTKHFRYPHIFNKADDCHTKTLVLLDKCRQLNVGKDSSRFVSQELKFDIEFVSMEFLILLKLGFEYLTVELLDSINTVKQNLQGLPRIDWENIELKDRIEILKKNLNYKIKTPDCLDTLFQRRDIVEHPSSPRIYNNDEQGWKNVHLAWILSGEIENMCKDLEAFVNGLVRAYDKFIKDNERPGSLEVKRGLKSNDPFKRYRK
jgi:hypothetical protein